MKASKFFTFALPVAAGCVVLRSLLAAWIIAATKPEFRDHVSFAQINPLYWLAGVISAGWLLIAAWPAALFVLRKLWEQVSLISIILIAVAVIFGTGTAIWFRIDSAGKTVPMKAAAGISILTPMDRFWSGLNEAQKLRIVRALQQEDAARKPDPFEATGMFDDLIPPAPHESPRR